ncbi:MAG: quinol:electron acceptor oxidoreductase subunit ActD [Vicinamibacterales bacterium]
MPPRWRNTSSAISAATASSGIACAGALAGFLFSTWMAVYTEKDWPLVVGNMPIVAWFPERDRGRSS